MYDVGIVHVHSLEDDVSRSKGYQNCGVDDIEVGTPPIFCLFLADKKIYSKRIESEGNAVEGVEDCGFPNQSNSLFQQLVRDNLFRDSNFTGISAWTDCRHVWMRVARLRNISTQARFLSASVSSYFHGTRASISRRPELFAYHYDQVGGPKDLDTELAGIAGHVSV